MQCALLDPEVLSTLRVQQRQDYERKLHERLPLLATRAEPSEAGGGITPRVEGGGLPSAEVGTDPARSQETCQDEGHSDTSNEEMNEM